MATAKEYHAWLQGVKRRLSLLVKEAGEQKAFCRKVWPSDDADVNKSKVSKWVNGLSGIHPTEAIQVAKAFQRRPAWLLFGEQPEREGATRPEAALAHELANVVTVRALGELANVGPEDREILTTMIGGADLLGALVRLTVEECEASAAWLETRIRIAVAIKTLPDTARCDVARKELQRAYASTQPPSGRVFQWQPVTFTSQGTIGAPPPIVKKSKRDTKKAQRVKKSSKRKRRNEP